MSNVSGLDSLGFEIEQSLNAIKAKQIQEIVFYMKPRYCQLCNKRVDDYKEEGLCFDCQNEEDLI